MAGSSPLTRGPHMPIEQLETLVRFIPAYAGNSPYIKLNAFSVAVHPRLRGELDVITSVRNFVNGSSPLTRGTPPIEVYDRALPRFIPAYAGNSLRLLVVILMIPVHPRLRGELVDRDVGTRVKNRFIPAYAGNSTVGFLTVTAEAVHPRLRGELEQTI